MLLSKAAREHLDNCIIPFWKNLKDTENGGYYGYLSFDLELDKTAVKGCILNSRIMWFFSTAARILKDNSLTEYAQHAYAFFDKHCIDREFGGVFWSLNHDGTPFEDIKHTYNQAS